VTEVLIDPITFSNLPHPLSPEEEFPTSVFPPSIENGSLSGIPSQASDRIPENVLRGQFMTPEDLKNIQIAINEFIAKALLPYVERQTRILNESVSPMNFFFG